MPRALLFASTGLAYFVFWSVTRPTTEITASQSHWPTIIWFSVTLLALAIALAAFGRMVGGRWVVRLANVGAAALVLSSVSNIVEDGLRVEAAFWGFIAGTAMLDIALLALTVVIVRTTSGAARRQAVVPAGTLLGILLFVVAGGPILLATWLVAAVAALAHARSTVAVGAPAPGA